MPEGSEEGKDSLEVELQIVVNFHMGHLQEQQVFLTAGLSLQSHDADFLQTQCLTVLPRQALNSRLTQSFGKTSKIFGLQAHTIVLVFNNVL